ncbi:MOSC domain-containing protein [Streptomyces hiroshimensis]|uniref:Molybdenum cofactor biosysynthesis protein n=1 Tax=Streptomyces hiroshimensis TaxID=66424 RepID=A0ABQ2Y677_9ACTN|nr:MOSC N-terminal beta barrel domain-containing protein [Streptomyces hiroshimensis]GGX66924.1 molybdenum cofactor biosysynthesis protein [Streptomyces hiroshimensis]
MSTPVLTAVHFYPVKSLAGCAVREAAVEPWGLSGDRRWMLADADGTVITQRQQPRLALASARPLPGGGIRLAAPGADPVDVAVPDPAAAGGTVTVQVFGDKIEAVPAGAAADAWAGAYLGFAARLFHMDEPASRRLIDPGFSRPGETVSFADGYPLLVTTLASLDALNALIAAGDLPGEGPLPMDRFRPNAVVGGTEAWAEDGWRRVRIGEVTFRAAKPCARCIVTTTDQHTAERGKEPLRTLARHHRIGGKAVFGQNLIPEHTGTLRVGDDVEILG